MIKTTLHTIQNLFFWPPSLISIVSSEFLRYTAQTDDKMRFGVRTIFGIATLKPILSITINFFDSRLVNFLVRWDTH